MSTTGTTASWYDPQSWINARDQVAAALDPAELADATRGLRIFAELSHSPPLWAAFATATGMARSFEDEFSGERVLFWLRGLEQYHPATQAYCQQFDLPEGPLRRAAAAILTDYDQGAVAEAGVHLGVKHDVCWARCSQQADALFCYRQCMET